jgi:tryptophanyl-tRNA synthetase
MTKDVILTGLRANSQFHIGNYLGAILPMVELQKRYAKKYQVNMFVPDLHSFTTPVDYSTLYKQTLANLKVYVAAGLDLKNPDTYLYRQSYIPAHSELTVILNNFTYYGELQRMTQFKEKSDNAKDTSVTAGLYDYPVLMAADILLYGAKWVPVGDDQQQHIELARDLAIRLNNKFSDEIFVLPAEWSLQLEFAQRERGVRIRSLRNPDKKMSKSIDDPAGTIMLSDDPEEGAKKVMSATTDSIGIINYDFAKQPGISNLLQMLALLTERPQLEVNQKWEGKSNYGELKQAVAAAVSDFLSTFQEKLSDVDDDALLNKLKSSEKAMNEKANQTLYHAQQAVGLRPAVHKYEINYNQ